MHLIIENNFFQASKYLAVHKCISLGYFIEENFPAPVFNQFLPLTDFYLRPRISITDMNDTINYSIIIFLVITNTALIFLYLRERKRRLKLPKDTFEVNQLLMDLMNGEAVIKCTRIVPTDIFLRSPRHGRS